MLTEGRGPGEHFSSFSNKDVIRNELLEEGREPGEHFSSLLNKNAIRYERCRRELSREMIFIIRKTKSLYFLWKADIREQSFFLKHMFGAKIMYSPKEVKKVVFAKESQRVGVKRLYFLRETVVLDKDIVFRKEN